MKRIHLLLVLSLILVLNSPCISMANSPGLKVGQKAPQIHTSDIAGSPFDLSNAEAEGPVMLFFYRGGWCPFCNTQLHQIQEAVVPVAIKNHVTVVGISVDLPSEEAKTKAKHSLSLRLISDSEAKVLASYRVQYRVPEAQIALYKNEKQTDLEAASGQKHHIIAVPSIFLINQKGVVTYAYSDENYKKTFPSANEINEAIQKIQTIVN